IRRIPSFLKIACGPGSTNQLSNFPCRGPKIDLGFPSSFKIGVQLIKSGEVAKKISDSP
ncbi:unnamed protein product, partial [Allacma fusca]